MSFFRLSGMTAFFLAVFCPLLFSGTEEARICFEDRCILAEVARTAEQKHRGLMGRMELRENGGMLFVYETDGRPSFWMKGMQMPLDFIWLDGQGRVLEVRENIQPCRSKDCPVLESRFPVRSILEIEAGKAKAMNIQTGMQAKIEMGET